MPRKTRPDDLNLAPSLTPAMRTALRWLPADGSGRRCTDPGLVLALRQLRSHGLCGYEAGPAQGKALWRLTGMARALRAEMERSEGLDAGPEG